MFKDMLTKEVPKTGLVKRIQDSYREMDGLGDLTGKIIKATTGIEPTEDCNCAKRKAALNKWVPFHKRK